MEECVVEGDGKEVDREFPHCSDSPELLVVSAGFA